MGGSAAWGYPSVEGTGSRAVREPAAFGSPLTWGGQKGNASAEKHKMAAGKGKHARQKGLCVLRGRGRWERQSEEIWGGDTGLRWRGRAKGLLSQKGAMEAQALRSHQSGQDEAGGEREGGADWRYLFCATSPVTARAALQACLCASFF